MDKSDKNSKISYVVAFIYGGISILISLSEVVSAVQSIYEYNDKSAVESAYLPSCVSLLPFILIAFVIALIWYIKRKNLPSKICMGLISISILLLIGLIIYFMI